MRAFQRNLPRYRNTASVVAFLGLALLVSGCQSGGPRLLRENNPFAMDPAALDGVTASQELAEVRGMIRAGEHSIVIPRLTALVSQYPGTEAATDARYFLGLTYYKIDGFYNAEQNFRKYLAKKPDGKYADLAREYLNGVAAAVAEEQSDREALEARVAESGGISEPEELALHLELADAYWNSSEYEKAGLLYEKILGAWPSLMNDAIIRRRIEIGPDGQYIVLTPTEVERRYSATRPLAVFNTQSWRSGRYRPNQLDYTNAYYNVSGQVVNQSDVSLREAAVIITIYGFGERVYDTRTYAFGRLEPGETRAFSVRFSNFDSIDNVDRYECVPTYLR